MKKILRIVPKYVSKDLFELQIILNILYIPFNFLNIGQYLYARQSIHYLLVFLCLMFAIVLNMYDKIGKCIP